MNWQAFLVALLGWVNSFVPQQPGQGTNGTALSTVRERLVSADTKVEWMEGIVERAHDDLVKLRPFVTLVPPLAQAVDEVLVGMELVNTTLEIIDDVVDDVVDDLNVCA